MSDAVVCGVECQHEREAATLLRILPPLEIEKWVCSHVAVEIGLWACCGLFLGCAAWQDPIAQPKTIKLGDMTFGLELSVGPLGLLAGACHVLRVVLILVTGGYSDSNYQASSIIPLLTSKSQKNAIQI